MKRHLNFLKVYFRVFGFKPKFIAFTFYRFFFRSFIELSCWLDKLFFSNYRKKEINKPILIIGHPRSGTTFLHRFLLKNNTKLIGIKLFELLLPSLFARNVLSPLLSVIKKRKTQSLYDPSIHKTGLFMEETDDASVFFRYFNGLFYWLFVNAWKNFNSDEEMIQDLHSVSVNPEFIKLQKDIYQKQLWDRDGQIVTKSFSLFLDIDTLRKEFPDGKMIVLLRDPAQAIPSSISLEENIQNSLNGFSKLPEGVRREYYRKIYKASLYFYKVLHQELSGPKAHQFLIITHKEMLSDFEMCMKKIVAFTEMETTSEFEEAVQKQIQKQKEFSTSHKYSLEKYGLNAYELERDFAFVYENYNV